MACSVLNCSQEEETSSTSCRTMAAAAKEASQQGQEASIRADVEAYFARAEGAPEAPGHGVGLPLSEKTGFLAKDVRMLLRDTGEKVNVYPHDLCLPATSCCTIEGCVEVWNRAAGQGGAHAAARHQREGEPGQNLQLLSLCKGLPCCAVED